MRLFRSTLEKLAGFKAVRNKLKPIVSSHPKDLQFFGKMSVAPPALFIILISIFYNAVVPPELFFDQAPLERQKSLTFLNASEG